MTPLHFTPNRHAAIMSITPDIAANWLEHNTKNRKISEPTLNKYVNALTEGSYRFNGDAIRFSVDGRLLDAQHRLTACTETGIGFESVVVWGIEPEAQITMDRGKKRTLVDHLRIMGEQSTKELATVLNLAVAWDRGERFGIGYRTSVSYEEAYQYLIDNPNIRASIDMIGIIGYSKVRKIINPAYFAFLHWVLSRIDSNDADDFLEKVASNRYVESELEATYKLSNRLEDLRNDRADKPQEVIPLALKAWNYYRDGEPVKQLRIRRGGSAPEAFPDPK